MLFYTVLLEFFCLICSQDFKHEVNLLIKLRHPNIVQFLGAVTETKPLMLVTEFLRGVCILFHGSTIIFSRLFGICSCLVKCIFQGDLHQYLKEKGALSPLAAINFALDIARYFDLMCLAIPQTPYPWAFMYRLPVFLTSLHRILLSLIPCSNLVPSKS